MKNIRKPLNCAVDGNEQTAIKAQLKDWCTKFFEKNSIYPNEDFAAWKVEVHLNTYGEYFARLFVYLDADTSNFPEIVKSAKIPATHDSATIAEAADLMVDYAVSDLINELENLITEQLTLRIEDSFSFLPIDVTVHTPGNNGSEWSADVEIEQLESAKTTEPEYFDASLEFTLDPRSIMTAIADCADYIRYQY